MKNIFDIIVIGGGHAGCEASLAASRMGKQVLLISMHKDRIGLISCNPAIGGLAKGQLVKEVDALGGQIGMAADATAIQFRTLNMKKGPAVRSTRAQVDIDNYRKYMLNTVKSQQNLKIYEGMAGKLIISNGAVTGVMTDAGNIFKAKCVIITTGTFLNGLIHLGLENWEGGRIEEKSSKSLSYNLRALGFSIGRLKTGTCPRIDSKSIDFSKMAIQPGDSEIRPFSFRTKKISQKQLPCHITHTNEKTHSIIRKNLDRSPLFTGIIKGTGVRYCPSIEDKIYRFPERQSHHIFIEPETADCRQYYPNGISTSLPLDVQHEILHSINGMEKAIILKPGYGIEYDYIDPTQLYPTLETKIIKNLYMAGQINGTTGYEEAAALGLMAGINASLKTSDREPLILKRCEAYIGVLIDDLVTKGTNEPYRMFTSRVEYRLLLREDNADLRLCEIGHKIGLIEDYCFKYIMDKKHRIERDINWLKSNNLDKKLRRPETCYDEVVSEAHPEHISNLNKDEKNTVEIEIKYEGFIARQLNEIEKFGKIEKIRIPGNINYSAINSLSSEIKEKLNKLKPINLGQASRISGITPAAVSILMIYIEKMRKSNEAL